MAKILIVDDDKNIRNHLTTFVRSLGHTVEAAPDAETALGILEHQAFDVVLSDVRMAGLDGVALLRRIREQQPDAAVVLMTAYAAVAEAVEAMRAGAADYLPKPFAPDDVRRVLGQVLAVQGARREALAQATAAPKGSPPERAIGAEPHDAAVEESDLSLKDLERRRIEHVLAESISIEEAAARLGINPSTLWRKRRRYGMR